MGKEPRYYLRLRGFPNADYIIDVIEVDRKTVDFILDNYQRLQDLDWTYATIGPGKSYYLWLSSVTMQRNKDSGCDFYLELIGKEVTEEIKRLTEKIISS
uniref:Uncharacterized protein n=1 Tax=Dictyoglomus turgidum TaxID=513050 RepID=A0A7C3SQY5_9BACT